MRSIDIYTTNSITLEQKEINPQDHFTINQIKIYKISML